MGAWGNPPTLCCTKHQTLNWGFLSSLPKYFIVFCSHALEFDHASSYAAARQIAFLRENWPLACHFEDKTLVNWPFIWRMLMICTSLSDLKRFFKMKRIEIDIMQFSKRAKKGVVKSLFAHVFWFFITSVVEIIIFSWFVQLQCIPIIDDKWVHFKPLLWSNLFTQQRRPGGFILFFYNLYTEL